MLDRTQGVPVSPIVDHGISFEPLAPQCGIEVKGLDLRDEIRDADLKKIEAAWLDNCVILFRQQNLDEAEQMRFAQNFGETGHLVNKSAGRVNTPGVMYISNVRENGQLTGTLPDGEMYYHSDQCYIEKPTKATMLYALEVPSQGGNTLFANMFLAWETLPQEIKDKVDGRLAMNVYDYDKNPTHRGSQISDDVPHFAHPVARTHPITGRKALFINRLMTDHIVGLDKSESDELLDAMFDHQEKNEFVYEHVWQPGDLLMWDNCSSIHARTDFSAEERRQLRRIVLLGDKPF